MKRLVTIAILTFGIFLMTGTASAQSVSGSLGAVTRGGSARGSVTLSIPGGLHVNSNRPNSRYAIPTTVKLVPEGGVKVSAVSYPRGKNQKFQFSEDTLNVYDGRVTFTFNVTVPASFRGNNVRVRAIVRYQACTDEVCYAPTSKEVTLTARVK